MTKRRTAEQAPVNERNITQKHGKKIMVLTDQASLEAKVSFSRYRTGKERDGHGEATLLIDYLFSSSLFHFIHICWYLLGGMAVLP